MRIEHAGVAVECNQALHDCSYGLAAKMIASGQANLA
jgi:hypothetical protein